MIFDPRGLTFRFGGGFLEGVDPRGGTKGLPSPDEHPPPSPPVRQGDSAYLAFFSILLPPKFPPPLKGLRSVNNLDTSQPFSTDCCQHCLITFAVCHPLPFSLELGPFLTYDTIPIMLDALSFCSPVSIFYPIDFHRLVVCLYSSSFYSV